MLNLNPMHCGCDSFNFSKRALLKANSCFDLSAETSCSGFIIDGCEDVGTRRRLIFQIDGNLFKFVNNSLDPYVWRGDIDDILQYGNSVAELLELSNIPDFVGKKVFPIIALEMDDDALVPPKIRLKLKVNSFNDRYSSTELSPVFDLAPNAKIFHFSVDKSTNGNSKISISARILDPVSGWSDFLPLDELSLKAAAAIQFKIVYLLSSLDGSDFARVNSISTSFSDDASKLASTFLHFFSPPVDFDSPLKTCYLLVKHPPLIDSSISASVNFFDPPLRRNNVHIGVSSGELQSFFLAFDGIVDSNVAQDSISIFADDLPVFDFHFDTDNSSVSFAAPAGKSISASWTAFEKEHWQSLTLLDSGLLFSRFFIRLTNGNKKAASIQFSFCDGAATPNPFSCNSVSYIAGFSAT